MRRRRQLLAALLALALGCGFAACGGGDDTAASDDAPATSPAPEEGATPDAEQRADLERLADCLRENGVEVPENPDPSGGPPFDTSDPDLGQAFQACQDVLPEGFGPPGGGAPPGGGGGAQ